MIDRIGFKDPWSLQGEFGLAMDAAVSVIQVVLTVLFSGAGSSKLILPYAKFATLPFQGWANDFKPQHIRVIGVFEAGAAAGMIVPLFADSLVMLTPFAAVGMALVMSGAMATHLRRAE